MIARHAPCLRWSARRAPERICGALVVAAFTSLAARPSAAQVVGEPDTTRLQSLHSAIRQASPELAARRAAVEAARARAAAVGFAAPLVLSVETEDVPDAFAFSRAGSLRLDVSKEFFGDRRRDAARALAQTDVDVETAALNAAERRVLALADRAIIRTILWTIITRRLVAEDSLLSSAEASLRTRFAVGDARYVDVLRLRTERLRVGSDRAVAAVEALAARRSLYALFGADSAAVELSRLLTPTDTDGSWSGAALPPAPDVDSLVAVSVAYGSTAAAIARARTARALTLAEQRPHLAAFAGVQRFASDVGRFTLGPVLGASISLPFTARRANTSSLAAADLTIISASASQRAAVASLRGDLLAARDRYEAARTRLAVFDAALLRGAREERESALASFRGGALSLTELLDFERSLTRAEIDRLRSRIDAADALADLLAGTFAAPAESRGIPASFSTPNQ